MADNAGSASPHRPRGPAFRDASAENPAATPPWRSFAVEAHAGRKIAGWPLGRFDIGAQGLRVRLPFPWFITRSAGKDAITVVSVTRTVTGIWCVRFEDSGQRLADAHVHLPMRAQHIIDQLHQSGYTVTDRKTSQPIAHLPSPGTQPGGYCTGLLSPDNRPAPAKVTIYCWSTRAAITRRGSRAARRLRRCRRSP
jgi:hypothetical protein